jgi:hypothetical protein
MLTGPKKNEYLGLIAPPGKKGLYLGYVNIPIGVGVFAGSYIAGLVYNQYGEKATLALKELGANSQLVAQAAKSADWSDSLEKIPHLIMIERGQAFELVCEHLGQEPGATATRLRQTFRHDSGQLANLALQYMVLHPGPEQAQEAVATRLAEVLVDDKDDATANTAGRRLLNGETSVDQLELGRFVHLLPKALDVKRAAAVAVLRERINETLPPDQRKGDAQVAEMLWDHFGNSPENLNNLALEYLAQGTDRIYQAVADMDFEDPVKQIEAKIGIGRTKSFAALSAAMGAGDGDVERALGAIAVVSDDPDARLSAFLAGREYLRFMTVASKDWPNDVAFLRELIESDPAAKQAAEAALDQKQAKWTSRLKGSLARLFGVDKGDEDFYDILARNLDVIQDALDAKDWAKAPEQAARLLQLNRFEGRALAGAEVKNTAQAATQLLWDKYDPQYRTWIPFAAIGVVAAIALAIFGQLAKRWKDMNA